MSIKMGPGDTRSGHGADILIRGGRVVDPANGLDAPADVLLRGARGFGHNDFKIELARRAIVRALGQAARG